MNTIKNIIIPFFLLLIVSCKNESEEIYTHSQVIQGKISAIEVEKFNTTAPYISTILYIQTSTKTHKVAIPYSDRNYYDVDSPVTFVIYKYKEL